VPFSQIFSWGLGSFGSIAYLNIVTALILIYLTTILKIDIAVAGIIVSFGRIIDAFCDPIMGWITDRTKTRWGRRRPYLLLGAVVCGLALPLLYSAHLFTPTINPIISGCLLLIIYSLGFTIFNVPYLTMPIEMTTDRMQRFSMMSYRVVFMMLGGVLGSAGAPFLIEQLGRDATAFQTLGLIGGAIVFITMLIAFLGTSGAKASEPTEIQNSGFNFKEQMRSIVQNKPFCTMIFVKVLQFFAIASVGITMAFFVTVVLKQGFNLLALYGIATTASIMAAIPFWKWLGKFITKRRGFMIGLVGEVIATLMLLLVTNENAYELFVARGILNGFFASAILLNSQAMWLDTIDYDYQRTGLRREGFFTSIYVFMERLGYSLGPMVIGFMLGYMGFDQNLPLEQQPESAELAVYIGVIWVPVAIYIISFFTLYFYRLPEIINGKEQI